MTPAHPAKSLQGEPRVERDVMVPMRDGVRLAADIYRPPAAGPHPVLLMRVPYGKDAAQTVVYAHPFWFAARGYIVVVQDTRGRFKSKGDFAPWTDEAADGYDTVEWAAGLPDSSGAVGMYGFSYAGSLQLQAAGLAPPHLRAIAPAFSSLDFYGDWIYPGGALSWAFLASWGVGDLVGESARRSGLSELQESLQASLRQLPEPYWHLPINRHPALLGAVAPYVKDWLDHPSRDSFWSSLDERARLAEVTVPGLHIGGWSDIFIKGTLESYRTLATYGRAEQCLVIGPWMHMPWVPWRPGETGPGEVKDVGELQLEWFDRWLEPAVDRAPGAGTEDPPVRIFAMGAEQWTPMSEWPPSCDHRSWFLHSDGRANSRFGDGTLTIGEPAEEPFDAFVYDPRQPVPSRGGRSCCDPATAPIGFEDQSAIEARNDVLVYTSAPLAEPLEIGGGVSLTVWAATTAVDTDFTGKLVDVAPGGVATNVVDGLARGRHRFATEPEGLLEPERVYRVEIDLGPVSWLFAAGHRLRLEVSSSNFPHYSRNGNGAVHPNRVRFDELRTATQRVYHDAAHPSALVLPVLARP